MRKLCLSRSPVVSFLSPPLLTVSSSLIHLFLQRSVPNKHLSLSSAYAVTDKHPSLNLSVFSPVSFPWFFFPLLVKCSVLLVKWSGACRWGGGWVGGSRRVGDSGVRHKAPRERQGLRERERDGMRGLVTEFEVWRLGSWGWVISQRWPSWQRQDIAFLNITYL